MSTSGTGNNNKNNKTESPAINVKGIFKEEEAFLKLNDKQKINELVRVANIFKQKTIELEQHVKEEKDKRLKSENVEKQLMTIITNNYKRIKDFFREPIRENTKISDELPKEIEKLIITIGKIEKDNISTEGLYNQQRNLYTESERKVEDLEERIKLLEKNHSGAKEYIKDQTRKIQELHEENRELEKRLEKLIEFKEGIDKVILDLEIDKQIDKIWRNRFEEHQKLIQTEEQLEEEINREEQ
ncbi:17001_t:CDS:1, partial [Acaulospora colombiana]